MRKNTYLTRKLSKKEQLIAEKYYYIIYHTLNSARCNQYRKLKRRYKKNISYDKVEDYLFYVAPIIPQINLEKEACSNLMLLEILNNLTTPQQKIIVLMLSEGFPKVTIKNYLSISDYYLRKEIAVIKDLMKNIYFT